MDEVRWLLDESTPVTAADLAEIERADVPDGYSVRGPGSAPTLAITLHDVVVYDVRKWFGAADLRLDALVVHGQSSRKSTSCYQPGTFRFNGVKDGQRLPIDTGGLLLFYGKARHFVDIFITVSRDRSDSDDLATMLAAQAESPQLGSAIAQVATVVATAGAATVLPAAIQGAALIGSLAYKLITGISGNTLGLYHTTWLQVRDGLGVGPHPETGVFRPDGADVSFRYEIQLEDAEST
jgi:hypothetical protein